MSKIGKAITVAGGLNFDFTLTSGATTYHFDIKSESSEVANVYKYVRTRGSTDEWYLVLYASATLTFNKLMHKVDYCCVGAGGGGGGGSAYYYESGGYGGAGYYYERKAGTSGYQAPLAGTAYLVSVGSGGSGGVGSAPGGRTGENGNAGGTTSFGSLLSASGGGGGYANYGSGKPGPPTQYPENAERYVFDDSTKINIQVCGYNRGHRGSGGDGGWVVSSGDAGQRGYSGYSGLFVIRSTPRG